MAKANVTSDMFEPQVFLELVKALEPSRGLTLYNSVAKDETPYPYAQWNVTRGRTSTLAEFNVPNSKANVVGGPRGGEETRSEALAYFREGAYFSPTATLYLKDAEAGSESALKSAEKIVAEQVATVNDRINNRIEWALWQAIQGNLSYTGANTGAIAIDYGFKATHKPTLAVGDQWDNASVSLDSLISNIRYMKKVVRKDSGVDANEVFLTGATMDLLIAAFTKASVGTDGRWALSDSQKDQYLKEGKISGFMGIETWSTIDQYYDEVAGDGTVTVKPYLPHGKVLMLNRAANGALKYVNGPSADFDAPQGHIGRFAKNWTNEDPSGRAFLIEESGLPVLKAPDQFISATVASTTWANAQTWS